MRRDSSSSSSNAKAGSMLRRLSTFVSPHGHHSRSSSAAHAQPGSTTASSPNAKALWLDCDPGHDDAIALLMAVHHPDLELLGVSTVAGNTTGANTFLNAVKLMAAYRASPDIPVIRGSDSPLVKQVKVDVGIHGSDGLGGVVGLPLLSSPLCQPWLFPAWPKTSSPSSAPEPSLFLYTLSTIITERIASGKPPIHIAVTGPMTNVALFVKCYPHLIKGIAQIVLMGGAAGVRGNRGALAEFNILNDPEAASIVFNTDVKVVMAGLNVTHQAIFTAELHDRLLRTGAASSPSPTSSRRQSKLASGSGASGRSSPDRSATSPLASPRGGAPLSLGVSPSSGPSDLKRMLSSALTFFAKTYASEFGFTRGPPVHDMLAIAYIIDPTLFYRRVPSPGGAPNVSMYDADPNANKDGFGDAALAVPVAGLGLQASPSSGTSALSGSAIEGGGSTTTSTAASIDANSSPELTRRSLAAAGQAPKRYRVDVECNEGLACGATVVDFWGDRVEHEGWGRGGRNVEVLENLDCPRLWDGFFDVVERAEAYIATCAAREGVEALSLSASEERERNDRIAAALVGIQQQQQQQGGSSKLVDGAEGQPDHGATGYFGPRAAGPAQHQHLDSVDLATPTAGSVIR